jgi:hypothetical protein
VAKTEQFYEHYDLTAPVLMAFPNLFVPKPIAGKGDPMYSANFIMGPDHPDLDPIKRHIVKLAKQKWPNVDMSQVHIPLKSGTVLADKRIADLRKKAVAAGKDPDAITPDGEYQRGKVVINPTKAIKTREGKPLQPPALSAIVNGRIIDLDTPELRAQYEKQFFFGAEVLARINFGTYDGNGSTIQDGVTSYLDMVLATGKGERLGGGPRAASEVFSGYVGSYSAEDPTGLGLSI